VIVNRVDEVLDPLAKGLAVVVKVREGIVDPYVRALRQLFHPVAEALVLGTERADGLGSGLSLLTKRRYGLAERLRDIALGSIQ
jgi:hypothetical protein